MDFGRTDAVLVRALDAAALRHRVIAHNVANADTPGYRRQTLRFEEELARYLTDGRGPTSPTLAQTHPGHLAGLSQPPLPVPRLQEEAGTTWRPDGNNVDIDAEMAQLVENQLWYAALSQQLSRRYALLRTVAREGR